MVMNVIGITRKQPVNILAWMDVPPMESYGPARGAVRTPALQAWNTALALGKIPPRHASKARPLGEIGRVRAPPGGKLVRQRTNGWEDRPLRGRAAPVAGGRRG